jgi:hypothetical protein
MPKNGKQPAVDGICFLLSSGCPVNFLMEEGLMRKLSITLATTALVFGALAMPASAQTENRGAASIHALKNATPVIKKAACNGTTGGCGCGPGWISACAPGCCRCVPCY